MEKVNAIASRHGLFVVEDFALAIGSRFKGVHAGLLGDIGSFSFYPVKHFTTGEGGMVTARKEEIIRRIERQKAFGVAAWPSARCLAFTTSPCLATTTA